MTGVTPRSYARHRAELGLTGKSLSSVQKAIRSGRLGRSVSRDARGRYLIEAKQADREWERNKNHLHDHGHGTKERSTAERSAAAEQGRLFGDVGGLETGERDDRADNIRKAMEIKAVYSARLTQLEYDQKSGKLVAKAAVEAEYFGLWRRLQQVLFGFADVLTPLVSPETDAHTIRGIIEREVRLSIAKFEQEVRDGAS